MRTKNLKKILKKTGITKLSRTKNPTVGGSVVENRTQHTTVGGSGVATKSCLLPKPKRKVAKKSQYNLFIASKKKAKENFFNKKKSKIFSKSPWEDKNLIARSLFEKLLKNSNGLASVLPPQGGRHGKETMGGIATQGTKKSKNETQGPLYEDAKPRNIEKYILSNSTTERVGGGEIGFSFDVQEATPDFAGVDSPSRASQARREQQGEKNQMPRIETRTGALRLKANKKTQDKSKHYGTGIIPYKEELENTVCKGYFGMPVLSSLKTTSKPGATAAPAGPAVGGFSSLEETRESGIKKASFEKETVGNRIKIDIGEHISSLAYQKFIFEHRQLFQVQKIYNECSGKKTHIFEFLKTFCKYIISPTEYQNETSDKQEEYGTSNTKRLNKKLKKILTSRTKTKLLSQKQRNFKIKNASQGTKVQILNWLNHKRKEQEKQMLPIITSQNAKQVSSFSPLMLAMSNPFSKENQGRMNVERTLHKQKSFARGTGTLCFYKTNGTKAKEEWATQNFIILKKKNSSSNTTIKARKNKASIKKNARHWRLVLKALYRKKRNASRLKKQARKKQDTAQAKNEHQRAQLNLYKYLHLNFLKEKDFEASKQGGGLSVAMQPQNQSNSKSPSPVVGRANNGKAGEAQRTWKLKKIEQFFAQTLSRKVTQTNASKGISSTGMSSNRGAQVQAERGEKSKKRGNVDASVHTHIIGNVYMRGRARDRSRLRKRSASKSGLERRTWSYKINTLVYRNSKTNYIPANYLNILPRISHMRAFLANRKKNNCKDIEPLFKGNGKDKGVHKKILAQSANASKHIGRRKTLIKSSTGDILVMTITKKPDLQAEQKKSKRPRPTDSVTLAFSGGVDFYNKQKESKDKNIYISITNLLIFFNRLIHKQAVGFLFSTNHMYASTFYLKYYWLYMYNHFYPNINKLTNAVNLFKKKEKLQGANHNLKEFLTQYVQACSYNMNAHAKTSKISSENLYVKYFKLCYYSKMIASETSGTTSENSENKFASTRTTKIDVYTYTHLNQENKEKLSSTAGLSQLSTNANVAQGAGAAANDMASRNINEKTKSKYQKRFACIYNNKLNLQNKNTQMQAYENENLKQGNMPSKKLPAIAFFMYKKKQRTTNRLFNVRTRGDVNNISIAGSAGDNKSGDTSSSLVVSLNCSKLPILRKDGALYDALKWINLTF